MKEEDYSELFERQEIKDVIVKPHGRPSGNILWLIQQGRCYWCNRRCMKPSKRRRPAQLPADFFTLDHIQSRWQGGVEGAGNVIGACNSCNQLRNNAEHKREAGRNIPPNQPEELRLKRFLPVAARTIPFEKGLSRQAAPSSRSHHVRHLRWHNAQH